MKEHKRLITVTAFICIIPALIGILLWNRLPDQIPIHWNLEGTPDNYASRLTAVLGIPALITALHLAGAFVILHDPKIGSVPAKILRLGLWVCPLVSLFAALLTYSTAFGMPVDVGMVATIFVGLLLISIGIIMPECPQNYTIGIKLPWTLADEENWKATHKLAGPLWIASGFVMILLSLLRLLSSGILFLLIIVILIVPSVYSWKLYRKTHQN